jgi:hypothetical protein
MKQCPRCHHKYADDLNFCLNDGSSLIPVEDVDKTWILPEPIPTITAQGVHVEPRPIVAPSTRQRGPVWKMLGIAAVILAVGAFGAVTILRWQEREGRATQNNSSSPTVSTEPALTPGIYEVQVDNQQKDIEAIRTIKLQYTFHPDGTYLIKYFLTKKGTGVDEQLSVERGDFAVSGTTLLFRNRLSRQVDSKTAAWTPWALPNDGPKTQLAIRNITPNSFQISENGFWYTAYKL